MSSSSGQVFERKTQLLPVVERKTQFRSSVKNTEQLSLRVNIECSAFDFTICRTIRCTEQPSYHVICKVWSWLQGRVTCQHEAKGVRTRSDLIGICWCIVSILYTLCTHAQQHKRLHPRNKIAVFKFHQITQILKPGRTWKVRRRWQGACRRSLKKTSSNQKTSVQTPMWCLYIVYTHYPSLSNAHQRYHRSRIVGIPSSTCSQTVQYHIQKCSAAKNVC